MIAYLHGVLMEKQPPTLLLNVNGVGYEMDAPMSTFFNLPNIGEEVSLYTHFVVRDDAQLLFAFDDRYQREVFRSLLKVSGVGPRVGLAILSTLTPDEFSQAISHGDVPRLTKVPGIGKKTAERLVIEMRDRILKESGAEVATDIKLSSKPSPTQDAIDALVALGYKPAEATRTVQGVQTSDQSQTSEELIRLSLRFLSGNAA